MLSASATEGDWIKDLRIKGAKKTKQSVQGGARDKESACHSDSEVGSLLQEVFPAQDWTQVSCIAGRFFTNWTTKEPQ